MPTLSNDNWYVRVSSYCSTQSCAKATFYPDGDVAMNHTSKRGPDLVFTADEWAAFIAGVKNNEFDASTASPGPSR